MNPSNRRLRWPCVLLSLVVIGAGACASASAPAAIPPVQRLSFDSMFVEATTTTLAADSAALLRRVNTGRVLGQAVVLSDPEAGDVKIFDLSSGALRRVVGAPGDGPGEFRHIAAIASAGSEQFAVLDQKRRMVSFRDTAGRLIRETSLRGGSFQSLVVFPVERRMVVSAAIWESGPAKGFDLHEYDLDGRRLASFAPTHPKRSRWEDAFAARFIAAAAGTLVDGGVNANRLRVIDRKAGGTREMEVAPGWYQQLVWPADDALRRGYSQQTTSEIGTAWMHRQRMMNGVYALGKGLMLVRFQAFAPDGERFFYYAAMDSSGRTLFVSTPTRAMVVDTHADTVYWVDGKKGAYRVSRGVLHVPRSS
jgi:hypothetical protein